MIPLAAQRILSMRGPDQRKESIVCREVEGQRLGARPIQC